MAADEHERPSGDPGAERVSEPAAGRTTRARWPRRGAAATGSPPAQEGEDLARREGRDAEDQPQPGLARKKTTTTSGMRTAAMASREAGARLAPEAS